ncbi:hypothetical protein [uncultured Aquimarina sp.]|uniref:hypothetical protein n=1 Tax=uncultured Aquimarina sp. TaxID=575652 RepID=UPI00260349DD|nr:hypothetical protein [uncultured Aquimarina sp.]
MKDINKELDFLFRKHVEKFVRSKTTVYSIGDYANYIKSFEKAFEEYSKEINGLANNYLNHLSTQDKNHLTTRLNEEVYRFTNYCLK